VPGSGVAAMVVPPVAPQTIPCLMSLILDTTVPLPVLVLSLMSVLFDVTP
jgi:hypothetical protein